MASKSGSQTSSTTTTEQKDQRVTATDSAIALGAGAQLSVTDQFSDNVLDAFNKIVSLAESAGVTAIGFAKDAQKATETALEKVSERAAQSEEIENANRIALVRIVTVFAFGMVIALAFPAIKGKK